MLRVPDADSRGRLRVHERLELRVERPIDTPTGLQSVSIADRMFQWYLPAGRCCDIATRVLRLQAMTLSELVRKLATRFIEP
jgi:hypothetical protein